MEELSQSLFDVGSEIDRLYRNFKKDPLKRKTLAYLQTRLEDLESEWETFREDDAKMQQFKESHPDHKYFAKGFYTLVEKIYTEFREKLVTAIEQFNQPRSLNQPAEQEAVNRNPPNTTNSANDEQIRRIRRQRALMSACDKLLESIARETNMLHSRAYLLQKISSISSYWRQVSELHLEIMTNADGFSNQDYKEESYLELENRYQETLISLQERLDASTPSAPSQNAVNPLVKLPKITVPVFSGDYLKWNQFHDLFSQLIHEQPIGDAQKMFYLKANVSGEAERLIKHLNVSEENYQTAWALLKGRYDNTRLIASSFLNNFLSLPPMTTTSATSIKRMHDTTKESLLGLENLGISTKDWDVIIIHLLLQKVDKETHRLYEQSLDSPRQIQKLDSFLSFLETRFQMLETLGDKTNQRRIASERGSTVLTTNNSTNCSLCKQGSHRLHQCPAFLKLSPVDRLKTAKRLQKCINCLQDGHSIKNCKSRNCCKCNKQHNTLLHLSFSNSKSVVTQKKSSVAPTTTTTNPPLQPVDQTTSNAVHAAVKQDREPTSYVFLGTALVELLDNMGQPVTCRTIIDSGSQLNFISERLYKRLGFKGNQHSINISGIGDAKSKTQRRVNIVMQSRTSGYSTRLEAFVLPEITSFQPSRFFNIESWPIPNNIQLADPDFNIPKPIEMLIGAGLHCEILSIGQIKLAEGLPTLQNSVLGWIMFGKTLLKSGCSESFCGISSHELSEQLIQFWSLEDYKTTKGAMTTIERQCEEHFTKTTTRNPDGRFVVKLPFSQNPTSLGNSKEVATRRFLSLERRLSKHPTVRTQYKEFIQEFLQLRHMEPVPFEAVPKHHYFMPHHCVFKPESSTTKLRVVFDASCKTSNNLSLNDILLVGPTIQDDLFSILIRFRLPKYVFAADISKMYRQILIDEADRNYQLILWRRSVTKDRVL